MQEDSGRNRGVGEGSVAVPNGREMYWACGVAERLCYVETMGHALERTAVGS